MSIVLTTGCGWDTGTLGCTGGGFTGGAPPPCPLGIRGWTGVWRWSIFCKRSGWRGISQKCVQHGEINALFWPWYISTHMDSEYLKLFQCSFYRSIKIHVPAATSHIYCFLGANLRGKKWVSLQVIHFLDNLWASLLLAKKSKTI